MYKAIDLISEARTNLQNYRISLTEFQQQALAKKTELDVQKKAAGDAMNACRGVRDSVYSYIETVEKAAQSNASSLIVMITIVVIVATIFGLATSKITANMITVPIFKMVDGLGRVADVSL